MRSVVCPAHSRFSGPIKCEPKARSGQDRISDRYTGTVLWRLGARLPAYPKPSSARTLNLFEAPAVNERPRTTGAWARHRSVLRSSAISRSSLILSLSPFLSFYSFFLFKYQISIFPTVARVTAPTFDFCFAPFFFFVAQCCSNPISRGRVNCPRQTQVADFSSPPVRCAVYRVRRHSIVQKPQIVRCVTGGWWDRDLPCVKLDRKPANACAGVLR